MAREIFNAGYVLFITTGDGVTFQPNPNSYVNPDHLSYFKFIGRIIGKAICDGHLMDAHFTRSFYKHILGGDPFLSHSFVHSFIHLLLRVDCDALALMPIVCMYVCAAN